MEAPLVLLMEACSFFSEIEEMQRKKYLNEEWMKLEVIPDEEKAVIQISQDLLTPDFRSQVVKPSALYSSSLFETEVSSKHYENITGSDLHDILNHVSHLETKSVLTNLQPNLVELLGVAGTGKTTAVKRLTYTWATDGNQLLKNYDLIFLIPFRDVTTDNLTDIVCDMQLLPKSEKKSFNHFLKSSEQARKVLFILDGVDENDLLEGTDLFNLVTGRLFPNVTVLITSRPEGKSLGIIDKKPRVKVTLHGTDKASVDRMLADAVTGSSEEEIESFKQRYEEKLSDKSLLFIPLYLTLFCFVLKEDIAKGIKCVNLKIPETMTQLFNTIMHVIVRRWLQKRKHNNITVTFSKSPVETDSTVPSEIKRILYFIGRICYKGLLRNKYQFSDQDAKECYLDMDDIKQSGLFTVGKENCGESLFTKHKQLQEYLAALYLACEGTKEPCFHQIMHKEENKGKGLIQVMQDCNMVKLIQFASGLSGDFLESVLDIATSNFRILWIEGMEGYPEGVDIEYAAILFTERNGCDLSAVDKQTLDGCDALTKYMCEAKMVQVSAWHYLTFNFHYLKNMIRALDVCVCANLLSRFYGLKLSLPDCGQSTGLAIQGDVCNCVCDDSVVRLSLDETQACLLSKVQVHNLRSVTAHSLKAMYVDVIGLLNTFPDVTKLCIFGDRCFYQNIAGKLHCDTNTKLKCLEILFEEKGDMPICHIHSLIKQSSLTTLTLINVKNILALLSELCNDKEYLWTELQHLELWCDIGTTSEVSALCALLQASSATLLSCKIDIFVPEDSQTNMTESLKSLSQLQELRLFASAESRDYLSHVLAECLPALSNLHTLEIRDLYVTNDVLTPLAQGIKTLVNLKSFTLTTWGDDERDYTIQLATECLPCLPQIKELNLKIHHEKINHQTLAQLAEVLTSLHQFETLNQRKVGSLGKNAGFFIHRVLSGLKGHIFSRKDNLFRRLDQMNVMM